jgi:hypothetical protein
MVITKIAVSSGRLIAHFSTAHWWGIALITFIICRLTQVWLDGLYVQSQFPVSFFVGQTTFDAAELKSYYAVLLERGTLTKYFWVQIADYVFMATVFISFFALMAAVYRSLPQIHGLKVIGWAMVFIAPMAAVFDALENLVSFLFIANPQDFADWLVQPYSMFAVIKFALFGIAYLWISASIIISLVNKVVQLFLSSQRKTV